MAKRALKAGDAAPDFTALTDGGGEITLSKLKGKPVVLYFYPKDDTPGCTKEACGIRDHFPDFETLGIQVFGVSPDSVQSHQKFAQKFDLPFTLLADTERDVVTKYGVWGKKKFLGRTYEGTHRVSFLIDPKGSIAKVYEKVKADVHAEEVLADQRELAQR